MSGGEEREATILLQVDNVIVSEVKGPNKTQLDQGDMSVLQIAATPEELRQLGAAVATDLTQTTSEVIFVIVGEHKVPIIASVPIIKKEAHKYTFVMPGLFLEVAMPEDVDDEEVEILETLFKQNGVLRIKGEPVKAAKVTLNESGDRAVRATVGDKISHSLVKAGGAVSEKIGQATPKVQGGITKGSGFACEKLTPNAQPTQVKDSTHASIRRTRLATKTAVVVSGQMASAMVALAKTLGQTLSSAVSENTELGQRATEPGKVQEVKKVAVAGVAAAGSVMEAGTEALKQVLTTTCDGLSQVVGHKYGEEAGAAAGEGMGIAKDVVEAGLNINAIGVKGLAKVAGKEAAKNILAEGTVPAGDSAQPGPQA